MRTLLTLLIITTLMACNKAENDILPAPEPSTSNNDELIFGHFYGMCLGPWCVEVFKLNNTALYEDSLDQYYGAGPYAFEQLSNAEFMDTKDLMDDIPKQLLSSPDSTFGCPDCGDQGGIYIQYKNGKNIQTWTMDQDTTNVPAYLHTFIGKINKKIELLNL